MPAKSPYLSQLHDALVEIEKQFKVKLSAAGVITSVSARAGIQPADPKTTATKVALAAQAISIATYSVVKLASDIGSLNAKMQSEDGNDVLTSLCKTGLNSIGSSVHQMQELNLFILNTSAQAAQLPIKLPQAIAQLTQTYNAAIGLAQAFDAINKITEHVTKLKVKNALISTLLVTDATNIETDAINVQNNIFTALNASIAVAQSVI